MLAGWFLGADATALAGHSVGLWAPVETSAWVDERADDESVSQDPDEPVSHSSSPSRSSSTSSAISTVHVMGKVHYADLVAVFEKLRGAPLSQRVKTWSRLFIGAPYLIDPLGEGPYGKRDKDPLLDFTRVDCLSFVEQVMALSFASRYSEVLPWLLRFRYGGASPSFKRRYYTMVNGWIQAQRKSGWLRDVTRNVAGPRNTKVLKTNLKPKSYWDRRHRRRFAYMGKWAPKGVARLDYIPVEHAMRLAPKFPSPALMHIVSERSFRSPYLISHTGLVIRHNGKTLFRHASRSPDRRHVEDRPVGEYLQILQRYHSKEGRRRVLGVNLTALVEPAPPRSSRPRAPSVTRN